jgi:hypothetical protein
MTSRGGGGGGLETMVWIPLQVELHPFIPSSPCWLRVLTGMQVIIWSGHGRERSSRPLVEYIAFDLVGFPDPSLSFPSFSAM